MANTKENNAVSIALMATGIKLAIQIYIIVFFAVIIPSL
jgi:hypothetical protein